MDRRHCGERQTGRADLNAFAVAAAWPERCLQRINGSPGAAGAFYLPVREHSQVRQFRPGEQVGRAVGTGGDARPATDAGGEVEGQFSVLVADQEVVGVRRRG